MNKKSTLQLIAGLLILLFVYTATSKLFTVQRFEKVLSASPLLHGHGSLFAWSLPLVELAVACFLFFPSTFRLGLWLSLCLMAAFTGYIVYMLMYTPKLPCSCGGVLRSLSWKQHLLFNLFFLALAILGILLHRKQNPQTSPHPI